MVTFQFQRIGNAGFVPLYSVPKKLPRAEYGLYCSLYCNVDGPAFCYRVALPPTVQEAAVLLKQRMNAVRMLIYVYFFIYFYFKYFFTLSLYPPRKGFSVAGNSKVTTTSLVNRNNYEDTKIKEFLISHLKIFVYTLTINLTILTFYFSIFLVTLLQH